MSIVKITELPQITAANVEASADVFPIVDVSANVTSKITAIDLKTAIGAIPGGSDKQVQFKSGSEFSGSENLTFNYTNDDLQLTGSLHTSGSISVSGSLNLRGLTELESANHVLTYNTSTGDVKYINSSNVGGGGPNAGGYTLTLGHFQTAFPLNNANSYMCGGLITAAARDTFENKRSRKFIVPKTGRVTKIVVLSSVSSPLPTPASAPMVLSLVVEGTPSITTVITNDYRVSSLFFQDTAQPWSRLNLYTLTTPVDVDEGDTIYIKMDVPVWTAPTGGVVMSQTYTLYIE